MAGRQAKILSDRQVDDLLFIAAAYRNPVRNRVMVLLSVKAGLRAAEIANLTWPMILDGSGQVGPTIALHDAAAKNGSGRRLPIHRDLHDALQALLPLTGPSGPVVQSERGGRLTPTSVVNWFARAYRIIGLTGCSSHSGRRTFITRAARLVHRAGGSLRDVTMEDRT
jgi:integrase